MPLGAREVLVAIRARDVTSRVLREIGNNFGSLNSAAKQAQQSMFNTGAALTAVGVGMAGVGAIGLKFFNDSVDSFIEYSRQAAYTKTQVDDLNVSVAQIADVGKMVASNIPVPFEQMQDALYDIFSSLDVNLMEAAGLLDLFSRGAVAGQTDVRTAARSTISVMNAYKLPFTDASKIMDIMFEMVRKGVGTYEEFNVAIGRAIPAAVSASQEFDTLAGVMAFLTRQGLSTQMAATSAARAMELFTKPDVTAALEDVGVAVVDAQGNFRQLNDIILDLANSEGWARMGAADRKKLFEDIFGTGTIQARRFFDTAIPNFRDLNTLVDVTSSSSGALGEAYQTMFEEPAMQAQLLANKYEILKVEIGEKLLPVKLRLMDAVSGLLDRWNALSDGTQNTIIKVAAGASAFLLIAGAVVTTVGAFMMLTAVLAPVGMTLGAMSSIVASLVAAIAAGVAVFRALGGGIEGIIGGISAAILVFVSLGAIIGGISAALSGATGAFAGLGVMSGAAATALAGVSGAAFTLSPLVIVISALAAAALAAVIIWKNWDTIVEWTHKVTDAIMGAWEWFTNLSLAARILIGVLVILTSPFTAAVIVVVALIRNFSTLVDVVKGVWEWFNNLHMAGKILVGVIAAMISPVLVAVAAGVALVKNWETVVQWGRNLIDAVKGVWEWFTNLNLIFKIIIGALVAIISPFSAAVLAVVGLGMVIQRNWTTIKNITIPVWSAIVTAVDAAWSLLKTFWNWLTNIDLDVWGTIKNAALGTWNAIKSAVSGVASAIQTTVNAIGSAISAAGEAIEGPLNTTWQALQDAYDWFMENFGHNFIEIWDTISNEVGPVIEEIGETLSFVFSDADDAFRQLAQWVGVALGALSPIGRVFSALASVIGSEVGPVLSDLFDIGSAIVRFILPKFPPIVEAISEVMQILGTVLSTTARVLVDKFMIGFELVKMALTGIFDIVVGVVRGIIAVFQNFAQPVIFIISSAFNFITDLVRNAIVIVSNVIQLVLNLIQGDWGEAWDNIKNIAGAVWDTITSTVRHGIEGLIAVFILIPEALFNLAKDLFDIAKDVGGNLIDGLIDGVTAIWDRLFEIGRDIVTGFIDVIKTLFGISSPSTVMMELGRDILQGLLDGILATAELVFDWFLGFYGTIIEFYVDAAMWLYDIGKDILQGLFDGILSVGELVFEWFINFHTAILSFYVNAGKWLFDIGKDILNGLFDGVKWLWEHSLYKWLFDRKSAILNFFVNGVEWLVESGKNILRGLLNGIKTLWEIGVAAWFAGGDGGGGIAGRFKNFFGGAIHWLVEAGKDIIRGLKNGIKSVVDSMGDWISDRVDDIIDAFKDFFGISSPSTVMMEVGKNFILGFMEGVVTQARNIPALISKIGMGAMDLLKYLGVDVLGGLVGGVTTGNLGLQQIAKMMASEQGWVGVQWEALKSLVNAESGWNPNAQNPTSSAYGLFQFLDSTWASVGASKTSDPIQQLIAGFAYIRQRYGNPKNAWDFWNSHVPHWYAKGSWDVQSTGLAGLHKGEMVIPKTFASSLREAMTTGGGGNGANFNFYGDVTFGSDMGRATSDLDFWARTQTSGV